MPSSAKDKIGYPTEGPPPPLPTCPPPMDADAKDTGNGFGGGVSAGIFLMHDPTLFTYIS